MAKRWYYLDYVLITLFSVHNFSLCSVTMDKHEADNAAHIFATVKTYNI